jgi:hypothetical protein
VLHGIEEGERVVTSGNTLLDAQAQFNLAGGTSDACAEEMGATELPALPETPTGIGPYVPLVTKVSVPLPPTNGNARPAMAMSRTNNLPPSQKREQSGARRTQRTSALMSPGAGLQLLRRTTIMNDLESRKASTTAPPEDKRSLAESDAARMRKGDSPQAPGEMRLAMAQTPDPNPAAQADMGSFPQTQGQTKLPTQPAQIQYQLVQNQILELSAISEALAADNLKQFQAHAERLPIVLAPAQKELAVSRHWESLLEPLAALGQGALPKDLEQARSRFLPFSTGAVEFVKRVRQDLTGFPKVMIYHCPMAPKPGLWIQAQGPLRNPFFGAKRLTCGEEVK